MKPKQLYLLLVVAIIVGVTGLAIQFSQSSSWNSAKSDRTVLPKASMNDAAVITIRNNETTITLERKNDRWTVAERNGYPADFSKIRELARAIVDLKPVQEMQIGPSQFARLKIEPPGKGEGSGTEITFKADGDKPIAALIVGKRQENENAPGGGRFVFVPEQKERVFLVNDSFLSIDPLEPGQWVDKTFFSADQPVSVQVEHPDSSKNWEITKKDNKASWELADPLPGESLNESATTSLNSFTPSFTDVRAGDAPAAETGLDQPVKVQLKTADEFEYSLQIGKTGPNETRYLKVAVAAKLPEKRNPEPNEKPEDKEKKDKEFAQRQEDLKKRLDREQQLQNWVYLVSDWSVEPLLKARPDIVQKAEPAASPSPGAGPVSPTTTETPNPLLPPKP
jgi:hypothetical protein